MMNSVNPILRVIQYLFKKENIPNTDKTIKSFFANGVSFPQFVALVFKIDEIDDFNPKPKTASQRKNNNNLAYKYLLDNCSDISKISSDFDTEQNQADLLSLILTHKRFNIDPDDILKKCSKIVQPFNIFYNSIDDLIEQNCLLTLLNIFRGEKVQYQYKTKNIEKLLNQKFKEANVPLVIDKYSFEEKNRFLFFIQIDIIFDIFHDKIKEKHYLSSDFSDLDDPPDNLSSSENLDENKKNENENNDMLSEKQINLSENFSEITDSRDSLISSQSSRDYLSSIQSSRDSILSGSFSIESCSSLRGIKSRKRRKSTFELDLEETFLLDTINAICKESNLQFQRLENTIEEENFIHILLQIFKNNKEEQDNIRQVIKNNNDIDKFPILIEYLSSIERRFNILVLDFENPELVIPSIILLHSNILNFFFLKKSKKKLFDRCYTILHYCDFEDPKEKHREYNTLSQLGTYVKLLKFVFKSKENLNEKIDPNFNDSMLQNNEIPIVINDKFLNEYLSKYEISNIVYYQLQFIFNYLDEKAIKVHVIEYFLIAIRKIKLIKVPPSDKLAKNIRTRNLSLILQMKRNELSSEKESKSKNEKEIENKSESENENENDDTQIDINEMMPKTFRDRRIEYSIKIQNNRSKSMSKIMFLNEETYWNDNSDQIYAFHDGILFNTQKKHKFKHISKSKISTQTLKPPKLPPIENENSNENEIYNFFYYNEDSNKWVYNEVELEKFKNDKKIDPVKSKLPLILIFGSKEEKSIEVCSKLTNNKISEFKSNQICVYGICDKIDSSTKNAVKCSIYLILHVPKSKEKLKNIGRIIIQIYSFLFFIQNTIIMILNDMRFFQLVFLKEIAEINKKFKPLHETKKLNKNDDLNKSKNSEFNKGKKNDSNTNDSNESIINKNDESIKNEKGELNDNKNDESIINKNDESYKNEKDELNDNKNDDQENDHKEEEEEEEIEIDDNDFYEGDKKIDLLNEINPDLFHKPFKYIFIIDEIDIDEPKKDIIKTVSEKLTKKIYPKQFFDMKSISFKIHFINIQDPNSYSLVFNSLNDFTNNDNWYNFDEMGSNFMFLTLFELSNVYIQIKNDKTKYESKLNELVQNRFSMLKKNNFDVEINDFSIMANLQKEMLSTFPLLDNKYFGKCNSILSKLRRKICQQNNDVIDLELKKSSKNNLVYLEEIIKSEPYWREETIVSIIDGHVNFLKEEFFNIIHDLFPPKIFIMIYAENMNILTKKINEDLKTVHSMFNKFRENLEKKKLKQKKLQKGANTTIRERENEREIKVTIQINGKLEDEVEQDF